MLYVSKIKYVDNSKAKCNVLISWLNVLPIGHTQKMATKIPLQ